MTGLGREGGGEVLAFVKVALLKAFGLIFLGRARRCIMKAPSQGPTAPSDLPGEELPLLVLQNFSTLWHAAAVAPPFVPWDPHWAVPRLCGTLLKPALQVDSSMHATLTCEML